MDYTAAGFWLSLTAFGVSLLAYICAGIVWWNSRGQITQAAIDRVEKMATEKFMAAEESARNRVDGVDRRVADKHSNHDSRIVSIETELKRMLTTEHLNEALKPIYDLVRDSKAHEAAIANEMKGVKEGLNTLLQTLIQRGLEKP